MKFGIGGKTTLKVAWWI